MELGQQQELQMRKRLFSGARPTTERGKRRFRVTEDRRRLQGCDR